MTATAKIPYQEWQRFREDLLRLRKRYSWSEISGLFGHTQNGGAGWAERADQHRSIVSDQDVRRATELVAEMKDVAAVEAAKDEVQEEIQTRLRGFRQQAGSWVATTKMIGKNPKSSGYYKNIADGKVRGGKKLLESLREAERNGVRPPKKRRRTGYPERIRNATEEEAQEIRARLDALHRRLGTWKDVVERVTGKRAGSSYYGKIMKRQSKGSLGLLLKLRNIEESTPPELRAVAAAEKLAPVKAAEPAQPWPVEAQEHLRAAVSIIEAGTEGFPKSMRNATSDVITQIKLAIDELDL